MLSCTQWATEVKIVWGFSLELLRCRDPALRPLKAIRTESCNLENLKSRTCTYPDHRGPDAPEGRCALTETHTHKPDNYSNPPVQGCLPKVNEASM